MLLPSQQIERLDATLWNLCLTFANKHPVYVYRLVNYIALFLLLLFCRVMVPDALLLSLHSHGHTEHSAHADTKQEQLSEKHTHCPVEDLFGAPYQGTITAVHFAPLTHTALYTASYQYQGHTSSLSLSPLRAPPVA